MQASGPARVVVLPELVLVAKRTMGAMIAAPVTGRNELALTNVQVSG